MPLVLPGSWRHSGLMLGRMDESSQTISLPASAKTGRDSSGANCMNPSDANISPSERLVPLVFVPILFWALALLLAWRTLGAFFLGDDITNIYDSAFDSERLPWLNCLFPMNNGFWRPTRRLLALSLVSLFGLSPLAFHLVGVTLHAGVGLLLFVFARRAARFEPLPAFACSVLFLVHTGGWATSLMYKNFNDLFLALSIFLSLLAWNRYLSRPNPRNFVLVLAAFFFGLASKETAVVIPLILAAWALARRDSPLANHPPRSTARSAPLPLPWKAILTLFAVSLLFALWSAYNLLSVDESYLQSARGQEPLTANPVNWLRQMADYLTSALFPYIHLLEMPFRALIFSHTVLWIIRFAVGFGLLAGLVRLARRRRSFELFCLFSALVLIALPSLSAGRPLSHYLYSALAFIVMAVVAAAGRLSDRRRPLAWIALVAWGLVLSAGFAFSPRIDRYIERAAAVERFVVSARDQAPGWSPGQKVVVFGHPHPGDPAARYVYGQVLFWITFPDIRPELIIPDENEIPAPAEPPALAYDFDGERLLPLTFPAESSPMSPDTLP